MAKKVVNRPLNPEERDRDVNHKLQLFGIYSGFMGKKYPSNKQIDVALNSLLQSEPMSSPSQDLSADTFKVTDDVKEVIANARNLLLVKNEGNLIQEFLWDVQNLQKPGSAGGQTLSMDKEAEKQRGAQAAKGLKTLGTLLITNGQFRKLLNDAIILLRSMATDSAQKAAGYLQPSEEQMAQIDQPAEEGTWHEKPNFSKEGLKSQMDSARQRAKGTATSGAGTDQTNGTGGHPTQSTNQGVDQNATDGVSKDKRQEMTEKTKAFLNEKMPQERREQTVWRLKKMIVEVQGHSDYQEAIETLLSLAEDYGRRWRDASQQGTQQFKGAREESGLKNLESKARTLIERFANCTSAEDVFDSLRKIAEDTRNDSRLRDWFKNVDTYIRKCLREQGFILQESSTEEWHKLYDEGRFLFRERHRDDANRVVGELKFFADQFDQDPLNKAFGQSLQKMFHDVGYDGEGKLAFKKDLLKDSTSIILPGIIESLHYVPLPRIEVKDPMFDLIVENIAVEMDNLMPNVFEFGSDNYWRFGRKKIGHKRDNKIMISATGIQTDWKDVSYHFRKKKGFPKFSDTGVMDIFLGGEGFSFRVIGSSMRDGDNKEFIKPEKVTVTIKNLDIKLKKSKFKGMYAIFKPTIFNMALPAIRKVLEKQIKEYFMKGNEFAHGVDKEAHRTREAARNDPEDARNIYAHYSSAIRKELTERKEKAKKAKEGKPKSETEVNIAMTTHDSIFKDIKLPSGISTKSSEYKDLAATGDRWESPVFSIGKASETTGLPKLGAITRKPHTIDTRRKEQTTTDGAAGPTQVDGPSVRNGEPKKMAASDAVNGAKAQTIPGTSCPV